MLHVFLSLALCLPGVSNAPQATHDDSLFGAVDAEIRKQVERGAYRGAIALVEVQGERMLQVIQGDQNVEGGQPMQLDSIFRIYSMTKPVTVVAALMLMEQGLFKLDDPVSKYLPQFKGLSVGLAHEPLEREMSVRDLMRHTSGLTYGIFANSPVDSMVREADVLNRDSSLEELVQKLSQIPLKTQPGSGFEYSLSIDVLGRLVEVLSKQSLGSFMQERIFAPLQMKDTSFYVQKNKVKRLCDLNARVAGKLQAIPEEPNLTQAPGLESGGGGLFSTAEDYLNFARMLLEDGKHKGGRLLKASSVKMMRSNQLRPGIFSFGLGGAVVSQTKDSGAGLGTYWWGGLAGTNFWVDPSEGIIAVFMIQNMNEGSHSDGFRASIYEAIGR